MSQSFYQFAHFSDVNQVNKSTSSKRPERDVGDSNSFHRITNVVTGTFIGLITLFALATISTNDTHATASTLTVRIPSSSEVPGNSDTRVITIPPTAAGKFVNTDTVTYWISTTHAAGYTLTASANELADLTDSSKTIPTHSIAAGVSASNYADDTYASINNLNNTWGYLPSKYNSAVNALYLPAPIASAQTIDVTNTTANNAPYTIAVGARADHTLEQGQYQTQITLSAVGNPTPYSITYNANAGSSGDTVDNMPTNHTALDDGATGDTINLASNYPYRNNYLFVGWCTDQVADNGACTGAGAIQYNPGATFELDQTSTIGEGDNSLVLYAMWDNCSGPNSSQLLYCKVRAQVKKDGSGNERTQTLADMQAVITEPTSNNPLTDTSNSGVYKYDDRSTAEGGFGPASDAANSMPIYYFRGILDQTYTTTDTPSGASEPQGIPSTGDSAYYQNYVRLSDTTGGKNSTCWRIVRTTGSGGIKMIYNGVWTGSSCANAKDNAAAEKTYFNRGTDTAGDDDYGIKGFIAYVGYNYNSDYAYNNTSATTAISNSILFKNTNSTGNIIASNFRIQAEDWYANVSNLPIYNNGNKLETSAGWCNDRTTSGSPSLNDTTIPYIGSGFTYFGAYIRNVMSNNKLSLTCHNITGEDLLSVNNGYLGAPLAPLTADEVALAGDGFPMQSHAPFYPDVISIHSSGWSWGSYLRSGFATWLLSPHCRYSAERGNSVGVIAFAKDGFLSFDGGVSLSAGLRPAISLASSVDISSGSGTSTDPWVITP